MRALWYTAAVVVLDQLTKFLVRSNVELHSSTPLLGNLLRLTYVENSGIVFGITVGAALPLFTGFNLLATGIICYYLYRERTGHRATQAALALVLGGAIGNLMDRLMFGRVVDFIDVGLGSHRWYVFNVADSAVTVGVILYLIISIFVAPPTESVKVESA
ncbi:MAG: signal peptidase II [Candidatus Marinimicrobia bacterium]|nr:signal peptidase II [Candidatus Neomarinimicrobiota bacterium]